MTIPGADGLIGELPAGWRRTAYAAGAVAFCVASYFIFVDGRIAKAENLVQLNTHRINGIQADIHDMKGDINEIKNQSAARDQKLDDMKEQMDKISDKLDRVLSQRRAGAYP